MPAYLVVHANITDLARFQEYAAAALPLIEAFGGERVAISRPTVLEGDASWKGSAVYQWESKEAALSFWNSPEYAEVRKLREGAAELEATLIGG